GDRGERVGSDRPGARVVDEHIAGYREGLFDRFADADRQVPISDQFRERLAGAPPRDPPHELEVVSRCDRRSEPSPDPSRRPAPAGRPGRADRGLVNHRSARKRPAAHSTTPIRLVAESRSPKKINPVGTSNAATAALATADPRLTFSPAR